MDAPILIDLDGVESRKRTAVWSRAVKTYFPGLSVDRLRDEPAVGTVRGGAVGSARYWEIESAPIDVTYSPCRASPKNQQAFSLMLQLAGGTRARQAGRHCGLSQGDFCLIDGESPFKLQVDEEHSKILVIQLPRSMVLNRHPHFQGMTATRISSYEAGAKVLKTTLLSILGSALRLSAAQQWSTLSTLVHSLGLIQPLGNDEAETSRVHRALCFIDARLSDPAFSANDVAEEQSISRRQLERIFKKQLDVTVTSLLWERRLQHAAALLQAEEASLPMTVTQVALASGFQDASHFSRRFKERFGVPPGKLRANGRKP